MNKLAVVCINCNKTWEKDSLIAWGPDDYSGSLCSFCFLEVISPIIRRRQLREGDFECFGKTGGSCNQDDCKYRRWCLDIDKVGEAGNCKGA
jgi:hypothetical protein